MSDLTFRKEQMKETVIRKVKRAQKAIIDSIISPDECNKVTYDSEDYDDPKETFYVTVPTKDNQLIQIMTNPLQYNIIESNDFSFYGCRSVYIAPDLFAFYGDPYKLEVW